MTPPARTGGADVALAATNGVQGAVMAGLFAWVRPVPAGPGAPQREPGVRVAREQYHRTLFLVIGFWALATCVAAAVYPISAFGVAVLGIAHVVAGYRVEHRRRSSAHTGHS